MPVVCLGILLLIPCSVLADSGSTPPNSAVPEPAPFSGKWTLIDTEQGGVKKWLRATELTVTHNELRFSLFKKEAFTLTYRWSPANPQHIDFTDDKLYKGVYQLRGDILKICWDQKNCGTRPTEVKTKAGTQLTMLTLKRAQ